MSHSSALREDAPANHVVRVLVATMMALILLISVSVMGAAPASATTTVSGSFDSANGFPSWYEDAAGPYVSPGTFPGEVFCALADSNRLTTKGCSGTKPGTASIRVALEGTFAPDGVAMPKQQIVFARIRVRMTGGLCANTAYQFVHPYGAVTLTTNSAGAIPTTVSTAELPDVGCVAAPCAFTLGQPHLRL